MGNSGKLPGKGKKTINGKYNAPELRWLEEVIKSKRTEKLRVSVLLLKDNVSIHTAQVAVAEVDNYGFEFLPNLLIHQPNLLLTFFCFLSSNSNCVVAILETMMRSYAVPRIFSEKQNATFFYDRISMLENCRTKCIDVDLDSIEKLWKTVMFLRFLLGEA